MSCISLAGEHIQARHHRIPSLRNRKDGECKIGRTVNGRSGALSLDLLWTYTLSNTEITTPKLVISSWYYWSG